MSDSGRQRRHAKDVDCKAELRRYKNREAARRVRERKSTQLNTLQGQVDELKRENQKLLIVIQQLQSTSLTPSSSNGASLGLLLGPAAAAAAPSVSARPADSMDSNPSAVPGQSPIMSTIRSGQFTDRALPRLHAIIEPCDSCPVVGLGHGDACIMSQPGNVLQEKSGALLSSTTLLPATMSAPLLAQQSSLSLRPDEVALQRTCGCCGDQECDECEGVRVTMCSNSSLPLITTPGPKPKPLTLEDLNLPVTVLETSELSPDASGAAAAGTSSRAVSSGKRQLPKAQDSFNSRETKRSTMSGQHLQQQQQQHSASALARQGSNQIYLQQQQQQSRAVSAGANVPGLMYSQQQQICSNNNSQLSQVQQQQAAAAMDLDLVETLEPTKPKSSVGQIDDGSSSGNATAAAGGNAAAAAGGLVKSYGGVCYMRKSSGSSTSTAAPDVLQQQQQHEEHKLSRHEGEADIAAATAAAAALVGPEDFTTPVSNSYINNNTDQLATIAEGTDLIGAVGSELYEDRAAAAAAAAAAVAAAAASARFGDHGSSSGNVQYGQACGALGSTSAAAAAAAATGAMILDQHLATAAAAATDMTTMQFIPMLPGPIATNQVSDHPAAAAAAHGGSSSKHHKGPKFLRSLAAAVGGLVRPSRSAASTPRSTTAEAAGLVRQFGRGSMSFTAAAPPAAAATAAGVGGSSSGARGLRRASETDAALATVLLKQHQQQHSVPGQMNGQIADLAINSSAALPQQQQLQLLNELMGYQEAVSSGGVAAAAFSPEQHQELLLLQQQQQEILKHQRLLRQQLQQRQQQQQQAATFPGSSGLSVPDLALRQQQQYGSSSSPASAQIWSSLSTSAAAPCSVSGSSTSLPAAAAAAAAWQMQQQQLQGAWVLRQQQGLAQAAAAAGLSPVVDDASEEDAVMQLALQEGVLLSGL